jgi:orotidine-5'-phosphate decarboxylase
MKLKTPIILALDVDDFSTALTLARKLEFGLGAIKLGPRLLIHRGQEAIQACAEVAPVFVDNKYYDIPNTMESAVKSTFEAGASLVTVHAAAGQEALERLAKVEKDFSSRREVKVLGVTVLTSFTEANLPAVLKPQKIESLVLSLAEEMMKSGLTGFVCSPHEAKSLREKYAQAFLVTPGIRLEEASISKKSDDQARIMTPKQALKSGSSALVIGRPLLEATDPVKTLEKILKDIA